MAEPLETRMSGAGRLGRKPQQLIPDRSHTRKAEAAPQPTYLVVLALAAAAAIVALWYFDPRELSFPFCWLYATTGLHCPGCGATRATHELLRAHLMAALHDNGLWVLSLPLVLYTAASEVRLSLGGRPLPGNPAHRAWLWIALGAAAAVFAVLRNLPGWPWELLAPQ